MPDKPHDTKRAHPIGLLKGDEDDRPRPSRIAYPSRLADRRLRRASGYAELLCRSNFSFLRGASHPEELARRAAELGYTALAITDRNTLAGVVRMHCAAKAEGLKLIIGAEITPIDAPPIALYATDRASYGRLARIITQGRLRERKGSCAVTLADIAEHAAGLIGIVLVEGWMAYDAQSQPTSAAPRAAGFSPRGATGSVGVSNPVGASPSVGVSIPPRAASFSPRGATNVKYAAAAQSVKFSNAPGDAGRGSNGECGDERKGAARASDGLMAFGRSHGLTLDAVGTETPAESETSTEPVAPRGLKPAAPKRAKCSGCTIENSDHLHDVPRYREIFGDRLYIAAGVHGGADDSQWLARVAALSKATGAAMVATNDVHYHDPVRRFLQDVLTCIREGCRIEDAGRRLFANAERHLKSIDEMHRAFADYSQAIARTVEIADRCDFSLDELRYEYPEELCPPGETVRSYLVRLSWNGAKGRYPDGIPPKVRSVIEHELELIRKLKYEPYFLTVWDIVRFARSRDILCQGRGSAANSAVCYCLGITSVDPARIDLLFERFVSAERNEPPDIDVDFEHERREEVFQYIYEKYGREHAGIVAEVITYRPKSAVRDVGKALGLSLDRVTMLSKKLEWWSEEKVPEDALREAGLDPKDRIVRMLVRLVRVLAGFPRHLSQHVGGFVITRGPLCEIVPIENGAMLGRTFIEWDKDDIDALGILKIDCLSLGMLTAIRKCFHLIEDYGNRGRNMELKESRSRQEEFPSSHAQFPIPLALHTIPAEDPAVYDMACRADTVGVFQIESRAQMSMLPRLKPRCYYDLVIEVAIVRPGPIQGGMVHPYLRRRSGQEPVTYPNEAIKEALHRTLGVPLFQEQAMRLAVVAAGFTPGEADQLRRSMGAWRRRGDMERFRNKLIGGMMANGLPEDFAKRCYDQICGFGEYGFPESHAASFALLVYVSAWLKRYHPAAFCAAIINSQPMGFYHPAQLVRDARRHGVGVLAIDVNHSGYDCRLERSDRGDESNIARANAGAGCNGNNNGTGETDGTGNIARAEARGSEEDGNTARAEVCDSGERHERGRMDDPGRWGEGGPTVRLGMRLIKGISQKHVDPIERAQRDGPFTSVVDIVRRTGVGLAVLARLAAADAMRSLGLDRREAVWQVLALRTEGPMLQGTMPQEEHPALPPLSKADVVFGDYATTGLSLTDHPMSLIRKDLDRLRVQPASVLKNARQGQWVSVGGIVLVRQRPSTAAGITFATIEDETDVANLIIRPAIFERFRPIARGAAALIADGRVQRLGQVVHIQVSRLRDVTESLRELRTKSRDFR